MTDFASELSKIFANGCSIAGTDWTSARYFDSLNNDCYASEAALASSLTSEAYSNFGFEVQYFIKKISTKADRVYGEDPLENVERRFKLHVYTESIPNLQRTYQLQGMIYDEIVEVQATITHFQEASEIDFVTGEAAWDVYEPKIGDIMYFPWCDLYYEVLNVKTFAEGSSFLSSPITYTFSLRVWRNARESVDLTSANDDKMEHLRSYVELSETFNIDHKSDANGFEHITNPVATSSSGLPASEVKSSGDVLSINDKVSATSSTSGRIWKNQENGEKRIDPFDGWV